MLALAEAATGVHETLRGVGWSVAHTEVRARSRRGVRSLPSAAATAEAEDTRGRHAAGYPTTPSLGFVPFRRHVLERSLCRGTSPTPSALRVSHPLDGLIPLERRGFVSPHIRP